MGTVHYPWLVEVIPAVHQGYSLPLLLVHQGGLDFRPFMGLADYRAAVVPLQHHPEVLHLVLPVRVEHLVVAYQDIIRLAFLQPLPMKIAPVVP